MSRRCTVTDRCTSAIGDSAVTITCVLADEHDDDHGRGFLRWDDTGYWYTQRWRRSDGTWHGLPDTGW